MSTVTIETEQFMDKSVKKNLILAELKKRRCRITSQRNLIIDIILENTCSCCKEIYYQAVEQDSTIGIATVYRMLALLEEAGVINRKNMYHIQSDTLIEHKDSDGDKVVLSDGKNEIALADVNWYNDIKEHLRKNGMIQDEDISIIIKVKKPCEEGKDLYD